MMLYEEGKFQLTDPVSRFIPAFRDTKVVSADGTAAVRRQITIRDLLTHRSRLSYGFLDRGAVGESYRKVGVADGLSTFDGSLANGRVSRTPTCARATTCARSRIRRRSAAR